MCLPMTKNMPKGFFRYSLLGKKSGAIQNESNFGRLVEVGLQNVPKIQTLVHKWGYLNENTYLLKTRNNSSTWSSCLFDTVHLILLYNSSSKSGWFICRR